MEYEFDCVTGMRIHNGPGGVSLDLYRRVEIVAVAPTLVTVVDAPRARVDNNFIC